jgi:hypothetical protein
MSASGWKCHQLIHCRVGYSRKGSRRSERDPRGWPAGHGRAARSGRRLPRSPRSRPGRGTWGRHQANRTGSTAWSPRSRDDRSSSTLALSRTASRIVTAARSPGRRCPCHSQASRSSHAGAKSACRIRRNTPASSRPGAAPARAAPRCAATGIRAAPCWRSAAADPPVGGRRPPQPACRRGRRLIEHGSLQPRSDTNRYRRYSRGAADDRTPARSSWPRGQLSPMALRYPSAPGPSAAHRHGPAERDAATASVVWVVVAC